MLGAVWQFIRRLTGGLRFRLTLTYVLFISILLGFLGFFFQETIRSLYDDQSHAILNEEWGAVRGYLRIEKTKKKGQSPSIEWYYDRSDPEEALIVDRLRQVYLLSDGKGYTEQSPKYAQISHETPEEIRSAIRNRTQTTWKRVTDQ